MRLWALNTDEYIYRASDAVFHGAIGERLPRIVAAVDTIT